MNSGVDGEEVQGKCPHDVIFREWQRPQQHIQYYNDVYTDLRLQKSAEIQINESDLKENFKGKFRI